VKAKSQFAKAVKVYEKFEKRLDKGKKSRLDVIESIIERTNLMPSTASTYYHTIRRQRAEALAKSRTPVKAAKKNRRK
jgi:hypothetical protein